MIVVCTGCSAKFRVADDKVGPRGVKLRCSKCQTVFSVQRPAEAPPAAAPGDPAADPPESSRRSAPPARRPTTLDARAAFEVDLEPHLGPSHAPMDPFAPATAAAPPGDDPFGADASGAPRADPFAALAAPFEPRSPPGAEDHDPFAAHGPALADPEDEFGGPPAARPGLTRGSASGTISLEELTTPPERRLQVPPASGPFLGAAEDSFGGGSSPGPGHSELDDLGMPTAPAGSHARPPAAPRFAPESEPLQLDPFTAAAVAADPLAVDEPLRGSAFRSPVEPTGERPVPVRAFRIRDLLVSVMSLGALLVMALVILVVWRGGLAPADALRPSAVLAVLAPRPPTGAVAASGVTSGRYERARGAPLFFVRGTVTSTSARPLEAVRVIVEVVRGDTVLARGEVPVGAIPGPEALFGASDAAALARALAKAARPGGARLAPGESAPFLVAFADDQLDLAGAFLRVRPVVGTE